MAGDGRTLGIDLGSVRIGLALSDPLGLTAQPAGHLKSGGLARDLVAIAATVRREGVVRVIVGHPRTLSGERGPSAARAEAFAEALRAALGGVPVDLWDERLTTAQAQRVLSSADVSRSRRREAVDAMAAAILLQSYLDAEASKGAR